MIVKEDSDLNFSEIVDVDSISHDKVIFTINNLFFIIKNKKKL